MICSFFPTKYLHVNILHSSLKNKFSSERDKGGWNKAGTKLDLVNASVGLFPLKWWGNNGWKKWLKISYVSKCNVWTKKKMLQCMQHQHPENNNNILLWCTAGDCRTQCKVKGYRATAENSNEQKKVSWKSILVEAECRQNSWTSQSYPRRFLINVWNNTSSTGTE